MVLTISLFAGLKFRMSEVYGSLLDEIQEWKHQQGCFLIVGQQW
jgi:hypothetical protein